MTDASGRGRHPGCCRSGFRGHQGLQCVSTNGDENSLMCGLDSGWMRCFCHFSSKCFFRVLQCRCGRRYDRRIRDGGRCSRGLIPLLVVPRVGWILGLGAPHRAKKLQAAGRSPKTSTKKKRSTRASDRRCQNQNDGQCKQLTVQ